MLRDVSWAAVGSALFLAVAVISSVAAYVNESWPLFAHAGVMALVGIGLAMLSLRE